ncbi:MAG: hypothetical protein J0L78_13330 [Planctomycetes bacterium]|nr:hypothetical protein [Planctomycetota bacterium]
MNHLTALAMAFCLASIALAQNSPPKSPQQVSSPTTPVPVPEGISPRQSQGVPADDTLITLDFRGGTIGDYVNAIRSAAGAKPVNVLFNEETAGLPMYMVRLTNASVWSALGAVERNTIDEDGQSLQVRIGRSTTPPPGGVPTYSISSDISRMPSRQSQQQQVIVLSLNPIIGLPGRAKDQTASNLEAKSVLSAIELAVSLISAPNTPPPVLQFHEPSGLLFVKGDAHQQRAAKEVIARLQDDVERGARATKSPGGAPVVTRRVPLSIREDQIPGLLDVLMRQHGKSGQLQIEAEGGTLVITGPAALVDKAEETALSAR